ncbi:hypothetical protein ACLQ25_07900 [Micromonospora sp. DT44]|uniref:hypothetical protein n=1 Tax=Micromonospora sp. DT44 TaxID=3393439 RepID=UPI003CEAD8D5
MIVAEVDWKIVRPTLLGVGAGVLLLHVFYLAVRTEWPVKYATLAVSDYGVVVNRGFARYLVFALGPTYLVTLLVSTTVGRFGGHSVFCALSVGLIHAARTLGVLIFNSLRMRSSRLRIPTVVFSALSSLGLLVVSFLGGLGPGRAVIVVPPLDEFFKAFWTAAFVAVVAVMALRDNGRQRDIEEIVERSRREVGDKLLRCGRQTAAEFDADPMLVEAVLLAENLERPRWFRGLERLKGRVFPSGTYGVMQVWAGKPISDKESIRVAVRQHLGGINGSMICSGDGYVDNDRLSDALRSYNPNRSFIDLASDIFTFIYDPDDYRVLGIGMGQSDSTEPVEVDQDSRVFVDKPYEAHALNLMRQAMCAASKAPPESIARISMALASYQEDLEKCGRFNADTEAQVSSISADGKL